MKNARLDESRVCVFSPCRRYRYTLCREWDMMNTEYLQVIGLNPSTADETRDDPTIRRCIKFAQRWGYGALCMTNLFAYDARCFAGWISGKLGSGLGLRSGGELVFK